MIFGNKLFMMRFLLELEFNEFSSACTSNFILILISGYFIA